MRSATFGLSLLLTASANVANAQVPSISTLPPPPPPPWAVATAQVPCINTRPIGFHPFLTFHHRDGRSVRSYQVSLVNFDPASNTITISDAGQVRSLSLNDWTSIGLTIEKPHQAVQAPLSQGAPILTLHEQEYELKSMRVSEGMISFDQCSNLSQGGEIGFEGVLIFDPANGVLKITGSFSQYIPVPPGQGNPGIRKGG